MICTTVLIPAVRPTSGHGSFHTPTERIGVWVYILLTPRAPWSQWLHCTLKHWNSFSVWCSVLPKAETTYLRNVHV